MNRQSSLKAACAALALVAIFLSPMQSLADDDDSLLDQKLDRVSNRIQGYLNAIDLGMKGAAKSLGSTGISGPKAGTVVTNLCAKWPTNVLMCFTTDTAGVIRVISPASLSSYEGTDLSSIPHVKEMLSLQKPSVSGAFKMPKGEIALSYEWPVVSPKGEFIGAVAALSEPIGAIDQVIKPELSSDAYDIWIVATDGEVVYSRYHEQIGTDPKIVPSSAGPSLPKVLKQIAASPEGETLLKTASVGRAGPKVQRCIWNTVKIGGTERRVVVLGTKTSD